MATIYCLETQGLIWYVGSTTQTLEKRKKNHRSSRNKTTSKYIPKEYEWNMKHLEDCSLENRISREQFWYDELRPLLNRSRPGQTPEEYAKKRQRPEGYSEQQRQAAIEWKKRNWEHVLELQRRRRAAAKLLTQ